MTPKFWEVFCEDGKEYKKAVWDEESLLGKYIEGEVVFSIANIFVGKSQSIICVAKEILVREIIERRKELFCKIPCLEKKLKLRNENAFFCISKESFEIHFFLKDNLYEFHLREQFFCRNKPINPVLIVRKLQYDYHAF